MPPSNRPLRVFTRARLDQIPQLQHLPRHDLDELSAVSAVLPDVPAGLPPRTPRQHTRSSGTSAAAAPARWCA